MDFSTQVVPVVIVLIANLLSGKHGSLRWETVTAIFGWATAVSLIFFLVLSMVSPEHAAKDYFLQISGFCLLTALARDYERILHPLFPWNK